MKKGERMRAASGIIFKIAFAVLFVLPGTVAFAGQGHVKRVIIHGKHEDKRAIENLADDSEDDVDIDTGRNQ